MDRCHFRTRGSGAGWEKNEFTLMCRKHHIESGSIGWFRFSLKYPNVLIEMDSKGWGFIELGGVMKLRRKNELSN
jgi:hypothetical protein